MVGDGRARVVLVAIVAAYALLGYLYAINVPKWNAPDEPAHYNYVKQLATGGGLPALAEGNYDYQALEELMAARFPDSMSVDWVRYESHQPPLYYAIATPIYIITASWDSDSRVVALRLLSVALGVVILVVIYSLVREVFPGDEALALTVAAFSAFVPMRVAIYSAINNDALAELTLAALLLLLIVGLRRQPGRSYHLAVGTVLGLALLTKLVSYVGVILVAVAFLMGDLISEPLSNPLPFLDRLRRWVRRVAMVYSISLLMSGWWFVRNAIVYGPLDIFGLRRHAEVVAGQPMTGDLGLAVFRRLATVSFRSFWAQFGWMGVLIDERIYLLLATLSGVALLGLLLYAWRVFTQPTTLSTFQRRAVSLLLVNLALVVGGVLAYNLSYMQPQGRYLFPSMVSLGLLFALGLRELLAPKHFCLVMWLLASSLFGLTVFSLYEYVVPSLRG